jgi:alanyl-tRNA synthetase
MVTERLYYSEPSRTEFDGTVVSCETVDGRLMVVLDRTAFYPTSGGQPFDTGTLGGVAVVDVVDLDDGRIGHVVDRPLDPGGAVRGRVDAVRRFDHMQQHTGQHILSAAFDALHRARTVGFHLGEVVSSLDLDIALNARAIAAAEAEANRIVWEDRPIAIRFVSAGETANLRLRKEPTRTGPLRIVDVEGFDASACGGTHVASTGQVGVVVVTSWERLRGGVRIAFACGQRALREYHLLRDAVAGSIRVLSVLPEDLPAAIERAQADYKALQKTMRGVQERLASHDAAVLVARGRRVGAWTVVVESIDGWDQAGLKALAASAITTPGVVVCLFSTSDPRVVVVARAADVAIDAGALVKSLTARFGGKGGGKTDLAQAGGLVGSPTEIADAARVAIAAELRIPGV